jgi:tetratricopeptide (TPR) repeat protein
MSSIERYGMRLNRFIVIGLCVLLTGCASSPPIVSYHPDQTVNSLMSIAQAHEIVRKNMILMRDGTAVKMKITLTSKEDHSEFESVVYFKDLQYIYSSLSNGVPSVRLYNKGWWKYVYLSTQTEAEAKSLADALYVLSKAPMNQLCIPEDPAEQAKFEEAVRQYREQSVKPVLPEEAWKYKVQADDALQEKRYDDAIDLYEQALKLAPWWPEGHFNRAMMMGNVEDYYGAVQEMKRYLVLEPNAPDARKAQDQVYKWEGKIK